MSERPSAINPEAAPEHLRLVEGFFEPSLAASLRATYDAHFEEPRQAHPMRFVWDYWHVPGQYTLHRTQAANYFEPDAFEALTDALTAYGQEALGCRTITPPWLSFYIDGCEQQMHADVPQGPFAYVVSLTRWEERSFCGGETAILQPSVLDYWRGFDSSAGLERTDLVEEVPARFNQLVVFDARLPHGVRRVEGVRDPREARLVLHGWCGLARKPRRAVPPPPHPHPLKSPSRALAVGPSRLISHRPARTHPTHPSDRRFTAPEPHFEGALDEEAINAGLAPPLGRVAMAPPSMTGLLSVRLRVGSDGSVARLELLADTLVADPSQLRGSEAPSAARARVLAAIAIELRAATFAPCDDGETMITLPLVFD